MLDFGTHQVCLESSDDHRQECRLLLCGSRVVRDAPGIGPEGSLEERPLAGELPDGLRSGDADLCGWTGQTPQPHHRRRGSFRGGVVVVAYEDVVKRERR